jgi:TolB-like protein
MLQRPLGVHFGEFEFDQSGELRSGGRKIKLQEQPSQILRILIERAGQIVSREELRQKVWPSDTFVDFDHGINNAVKRLREALGDTAETPRYVETLPRRGYRFIGTTELPKATMGQSIQSLAVLPLENLSRDPEQEYFADGLTEALITHLAKISALRVTSRTTAMHYKNVRRPLPELARELGVDAVVEGAVLRAGERLRISVQLIEARTDQHLWAESYDRDLRDVLDLQTEVARAVAREIQVKMTPREQEQLERIHRVDAQAYEEYLKGRYYWNKRTAESFRRGAEHFERAIEKDASYAAAYAGLADCASSAGFWGLTSPSDGCGKAKSAARKSLEIEETVEGHTSLAIAILHYDFDLAAAEREFRRAFELNPRYPLAHQWHAHCLTYAGDLDKGLEAAKAGLELDPLSININITYTGILWWKRQWQPAFERCRKILELDPNFATMRWILANLYQSSGEFEEAIAERKHDIEISGGHPLFVSELGDSYAAAGRREEALQVVQELQQLSKHRYVMAYWMALIYAGLNDRDKAFDWLHLAREERSPMLAFLKADPRIDNLRSDPRYVQILKQMNFPVKSVFS